MSIHKRTDRGGTNWRVHYRVAGKQRTRTFDRKADAVQFDALMKRRRQLGPLLTAEMERESMTLDGFVRGPWRKQATTLAEPTRDKYAWALEKHLADLLDEPLLALDVARLAAHQGLMLERGCTPSTVREVLARLSGVLQHASQLGYIPVNSVRLMSKVPADPKEEVKALAPVELERLIAGTAGRDRAIMLLAGHLGLRPIEVRSAPWSALGGDRFTIGRNRTKRTAARTRVIAVPEVTLRDLREWRMASGRPGDDEPIVGEMSMNALKLWGRRHLPAGFRVLDLRHSHASALHYVGFTVPEAARRMGHGPALHVETYAHIIDSISGRRYDGLNELIAVARAELVLPLCYPDAAETR